MARRTTFVADEVVEKHGQAVKRFQSLCDMNRIAFGEAKDLSGLVKNLKENRHFAMDFWAMVGDLSARERGTLDDREMLSSIVEGTTGTSMDGVPESEAKALHELKQMLAGVDVEAPILPDSIAEPEDALLNERGKEERRQAVQAVSTPPRTDPHEIDHARLKIAEALLRLEQTSRELREHLHAIEEMKSQAGAQPRKIEADQEIPFFREEDKEAESSAAEEERIHPMASADAKDTGSTRAAAVSQAGPEEPILARRILSPRPSDEEQIFELRSEPRSAEPLRHRGFVPSDADDDPTIAVPLATYEESQRRGLAGVIAMVLGVALLAWAAWFAVSRGYTRQWVSDFVPATKEKLALFREELHDLTHQEPTKPAMATGGSPQTTPPARTMPPPARAEANTANATASRPDRMQQEATPAPPQDQKKASLPVAPPADSAPLEQPSAAEIHAVHVPAGAMEANLMVSRVPVYPEDAKSRGIEGTVVMEAVISRSGAVQHVRVLSGDPALRAAAVEAVLRRRYKPYLLNGRPMDVATQVSVVFRLPGR